MTSARDQQIRAIHVAALERPAAEGAAFVAVLSGGDHEMRQSVERSLAEQNATDVGARGDAGEVPELAAGTRIDHYRIDGVLGAAAWGPSTERPTRSYRSVAIKFFSIAEADADAKRRSRQEAQTASVHALDVSLDGRRSVYLAAAGRRAALVNVALQVDDELAYLLIALGRCRPPTKRPDGGNALTRARAC